VLWFQQPAKDTGLEDLAPSGSTIAPGDDADLGRLGKFLGGGGVDLPAGVDAKSRIAGDGNRV